MEARGAWTELRGRTLDPRRPRPSAYTEGLWGFLLSELTAGRTRLLIGGYEVFRPRWLGRLVSFWVSPTVVWIMQARMLAVLKRNAEQATRARASASGDWATSVATTLCPVREA